MGFRSISPQERQLHNGEKEGMPLFHYGGFRSIVAINLVDRKQN